MRKAGATIVDVRLPKWLLESKVEFYNAIRMPRGFNSPVHRNLRASEGVKNLLR
jgi:hypothetical protein